MIPSVTNTDGRPTVAYPLAIVVFISAIKDLFEDRQRASQDREENQRHILRAEPQDNIFVPDQW